jgi:hypothetical protein
MGGARAHCDEAVKKHNDESWIHFSSWAKSPGGVQRYVLTENHFHLVVMTPEGNLSQWMHQLKTAYTLSVVFAERLEKDSALLRKVSLVQEALELR